MKRKLGVVAVLAGLLSVGVAQTKTADQAKPNFGGTWKLNLQKSDLGQMAPSSEIDTISQTADEVKVAISSEREQGKMNFSFAAKLDGTDTPLPSDAFPAESPFKILSSKAEWVGGSLVITQTTSFQDAKGSLKSTYTLSDDGKVLTKATHITFDQGEFDSKSVYDKV
jgi:hypothetical protein